MAEVTSKVTNTEVPVIAKSGKPEPVKFSGFAVQPSDNIPEFLGGAGSKSPVSDTPAIVDNGGTASKPAIPEGQAPENAGGTAAAGAAEGSAEAGDPNKGKPKEYTEDQKKEFLKSIFGEEVDVESLKQKLKPEPSKEDKKKAEIQKELRLLELYVENGGTPENFNTIKQIANADLKEFSKADIFNELTSQGFSEKEAQEIIAERYFQIELDKIEQDLEETDAEFEARKKALQKKVDYGTKKLESRSSYKQQQAKSILKGLEHAIQADEQRAAKEATLLSNVDKTLTEYSRKKSYEMGKFDNVDLPPIEHEISEESVKKAAAILKDASKRQQFFNNKDGSLNVSNLADILITYFEHNRAIKGALLEGQSRSVAEIRKTFGASPYDIGLVQSVSKNTNKGVVAKIGRAQRVTPQHN